MAYKTPKKRGLRRPLLYIGQILAWADAHFARTGDWPKKYSGEIPDTLEKWINVDQAMRKGLRGLRPGWSLAILLAKHRGYRNMSTLPPLTIENIVSWADAHHERTGNWPHHDSGPIPDSGGETWSGVESALTTGIRYLPGGSTLARVLEEHRGVRNIRTLPPFTIEDILRWADACRDRTGNWPRRDSGPIPEAPGDTWSSVHTALIAGVRSLPGGLSLARLLDVHRGVRNRKNLPDLSVDEILRWADAHRQRTGQWPTALAGAILDADGETWAAVASSLRISGRGLRVRTTLTQLLAKHRGIRNIKAASALTPAQILQWADAHHRRTGRWPNRLSGPIPDSNGETWTAVDIALQRARRGIQEKSSLAKLLAKYREVRNSKGLPGLTHEQILQWADAHHQRTGNWPKKASGAVADAPGEKWSAIDTSLIAGRRGLPPGSSLARLLAEFRGVRNIQAAPPLSLEQIVEWAKAFRRRAGKWPTRYSGPIDEAPGETWWMMDQALRHGRRGLPPSSSLSRFLANMNPD